MKKLLLLLSVLLIGCDSINGIKQNEQCGECRTEMLDFPSNDGKCIVWVELEICGDTVKVIESSVLCRKN
jgi:hypothetical protein